MFSSSNGKKNADTVTDQRAVKAVSVCERDSHKELLKNSVLFKRRYLSNRRLYRNETERILQRKVCSFRKF